MSSKLNDCTLIGYKDKNFYVIIHFLILFFCLASSGNLFAQDAKVNISLKEAHIKRLFKEIEKQTNYRFSYRATDIIEKERVTLNVKDQSVATVLKSVLPTRKLQYSLDGNKIILMPLQPIRTKEGKVKASGVVKDKTGEPLIGVTVLLKGHKGTGTITDFDGNFSLDNIPAGSLLQFSYIGYETIEMFPKDNMNIVLSEDSKTLEEVVVVGYTSSSKRDLIASVSTVKTEQLSNIPVANISQGLAGRSPGVIIQASGGGINNKPSISIRGGGDPIYVIDGVIRSSADFQSLSPEDIEGMSILKDASATAVYGSRATNGIVQVTTKKGKEGKATVEYDFNYSWAQPSTWRNLWILGHVLNMAI